METEIVLEPEILEDIRVKEPSLWRVIMHNDDKTTMDFVIMILVKLFNKNPEEAAQCMLEIHEEGSSIVGLYTHEIAEEKMNTATRTARGYGFPLQVTIEEEE